MQAIRKFRANRSNRYSYKYSRSERDYYSNELARPVEVKQALPNPGKLSQMRSVNRNR